MISVHLRVVLQRFLELLFTNTLISVFVSFLNFADIIETESGVGIWLVIGFVLFLYINIRLLRQCYFELKNKFVYYFVNLLAYFLFMVVSFGIYYCFSMEIFSLFFAIFKILKYSRMATGVLCSLVIGHSIGFLCVFLSPLGMSWVFSRALTED